MKLFLTLLLATCALAAPQWPGAGSSGSGPPAGVGGPPKAGGWSPTASDSESELLTIEVLEEHENYEIRQLPAAKWACTKLTNVDPMEDPMRNWQENYDTAREAMQGKNWKKGPSSKMFMKMFKYILGVNKDATEIEMTRPVLTSVLATENNLVDQEMCFWLGTPWENKEAPQPIDKSVTIQEKPSMIFYASTFNGQMLSHQDWESKYNDLEGILSADDTATANPDIWYHIGYDSPFTPAERRRNEIWIPQGQVDETNVVSA